MNPLCCCYSEFSCNFVVSVGFVSVWGGYYIIRDGLRMRVDCSELTVYAAGGISGCFLTPLVCGISWGWIFLTLRSPCKGFIFGLAIFESVSEEEEEESRSMPYKRESMREGSSVTTDSWTTKVLLPVLADGEVFRTVSRVIGWIKRWLFFFESIMFIIIFHLN